MRLFGRDLIARVLFEHDAFARDHHEQLAIFLKTLPLMLERLAQDFIDVVLVRLEQRADLERRVTTQGL